MDILAARKKAAEQASTRNKPDPEATAPAAQPRQEQEAPPAFAEPDAAPSEMVEESPSAANVVAAVEASPDTTDTIPASFPGEPEEARQQETELLSFRLGGEEYVVLVADVREVLKLTQPTIVPNTPDYILGVMSLRGTMLPIIDLRKRFGLSEGIQDDKMRIVVVSSADEAAGLLVERVTGVFTVLPEEIKPAPENIEQGAEFLRGIVRKDEKLYILLDLEKAVGV